MIRDRAPWRILVVSLVVLVGIALRVHRLGSWPLHGDEVSSMSEVRDFVGGHGLSTDWVQATSPLAHASLALAMNIAGETPFGVRLAPLACGVLALLLTYPLTRAALGHGAATLCVAVIAFSPDHIWISGFGRYYSALFLCGLVTIGGLGMVAARGSWLGLCLALLGLGTGIAFHLTAALLLPGCLLVLLLLTTDRSERQRANVALVGLAVLLATIGVVFVSRYSALMHVYRNVIVNFPRALGYRPMHMVLSLASNLGIGACFFAVVGGAHAILARNRCGLAILLPVVLAVGTGITMSFFVTFGLRYLHAASPGIALLAAYGMAQVLTVAQDRRLLQLAAVGMLFVPQAPALASNLLKDNQRYDVEGAAKVVAKLQRPGDVIVAETHSALDYYTHLRSEELPDTTPRLETVLRQHRRVILVALYQRGKMIASDSAMQSYIDMNLQLETRIYQRRFDSYRFEVRVYTYPHQAPAGKR